MKLRDVTLSYGTLRRNNFTKFKKTLHAALKNKVQLLDTAILYGNQHFLKRALEELYAEHDFGYRPMIQSKIWPDDFHKGIKKMYQVILDELGVEKIDSLLLHRPHLDMAVNVQAWKELIEIKKAGLVRYIGVSNFDPDMVKILINETGVAPCANQIEGSLNYIRRDRIKYTHEVTTTLQFWRPFGNKDKTLKDPLVIEMAKKYHCTPAQMAIAYARSYNATVVFGTDIPSEVDENFAALKIKISDEDRDKLYLALNTYENSSSKGNDSYANLSLDKKWYGNFFVEEED